MAVIGLAISNAGTLAVYALYALLKVFYQEFTSPLRNVPGPNTDHRFLGNRPGLFGNFDGQEEPWTTQYGRTLRINSFLGRTIEYTIDTKPLQHSLTNSYLYRKPAPGRYFLTRVVGPGILLVGKDDHRKQRKIMVICSESGGVARVNVLPEFSTAALDIIGKDSIMSSRLSAPTLKALVMSCTTRLRRYPRLETCKKVSSDILKVNVPFARSALPNSKVDNVINGAEATMCRIGPRLLQDSRQKILEGSSADSAAPRDPLSLLVRANMAKDISEAQRLSDEDVLACKCFA
ncbi:hypothetical protein MVEN_01856800 [Mycena venus]|uniref:Cytochrome P450 n=1 Tax=Mycena venus TaxID=2733690 RepID=A0A8H7CKM3_9AGAR|nr:hypothetical protein MVEN_01856800 [Mycena venus]